jgi:hypothetical protein
MLYGMQGMSSDVLRCVQCWYFLHCWAAAAAGCSGGGQYDVRYAGHEQ